MTFVAVLVAVTAVLYGLFFYLLSLLLAMGTPRDAVWAAAHRTWLGASATLLLLVLFIFLRLAGVPLETNLLVGQVALWVVRAAAWTWVVANVYRVTRWRKGKLAVSVLAGLGFSAGVDLALARIGAGGGALPAFGSWLFHLA